MPWLPLAVFAAGLACAEPVAPPDTAPLSPAPPVVPAKLTLTDCERLALDYNPDLRTASTGFLDAEGRVIHLRAILYPSVTSQQLSTPLTFYVQINQVLYSRATVASFPLSHLIRDQPFINYRQTMTDVVYQVRQAFIATLAAQAQAGMLHDFTSRQDHNVTLSQQLFDAGKAHRSDVLSLQVKANLARQRATLADLSHVQALLQLGQAMGVNLPSRTALEGTIGAPSLPAHLDPAQLAAQALRDRDDLKLLASLQLSGQQQIEFEQKDAYPIVGFSSDSAIQPPAFGPTGSFDLERNYDEPATQRVAGNTQLPLSLYVNWLISDGGMLRGRRVSAEAQLMSQQVALEALRTSIPGEVNAAIAQIVDEQQILQTLDAQESPAAVRQAGQVDYDAGHVRQLDLAELDDSILQEEQVRLNANARLMLAAAALDHALGRGLEAPLTTTAR
jgi:outer membrane protein TolC